MAFFHVADGTASDVVRKKTKRSQATPACLVGGFESQHPDLLNFSVGTCVISAQLDVELHFHTI
jgi:hypothetical protein